MARLLHSKAFLSIVFSIMLSCIGGNVKGQSATSALSINGQGYDVEVSLDNGVYRIKLSKDKDNSITEKTNYFTINTFRDIVFDIHRKTLTDNGSPGITPAIRTAAEPSISSAFLQLITELYNTEALGQKIGEITLNSSVTINDNSQSSGQSALGTKAALHQRGGRKWTSRIEKKKKRSVSKDIKKLTKKKILHGLDKTGLQKLKTLESKLKTLEAPVSGARSNTKTEELTIETARVVFEDGSIKEVTIKGTNGLNTEIYSNKFSIGASTRRNIQDFDRISLYQETHEGTKSRSKKITLSDVIQYERIIGLRTNDYSPADVKIQLEPEKPQDLFKASSSSLFTLNVFSDLAGFDQNNPNGLVQLEFNKRINLWTRRTDAWFPKGLGFGMFTHMIPTFELTKIEENNRSIKLINSGIVGEVLHLNPLQLQRFGYARLTNELNFIDLEGASLSIHANLFGGITVTHVQDTTGTGMDEKIFDENINSLMLGGNVKAIFNPESKWAFELGSRWTYFDPLNSNFTFRSRENDVLKGPNNLLNTWEFLFTWNTGDTNGTFSNKLFGRFRFNHEWGYWNNNYSEFQIGYSIFLKSSQLNKK